MRRASRVRRDKPRFTLRALAGYGTTSSPTSSATCPTSPQSSTSHLRPCTPPRLMLTFSNAASRGAFSGTPDAWRQMMSSTPPCVNSRMRSPSWRLAMSSTVEITRDWNWPSVSPPSSGRKGSRLFQAAAASGACTSIRSWSRPSSTQIGRAPG
ncbi:hypothetical protein G6F23_015071 [Rhizopus arrhizus]|nr:hypothetical protein G6F23_015071 [Rhizopus arrhizus]